MPSLVSHPDEVKVVSRRFGMGAADIEKYMELDGYKAVRQAIEKGAVDGAAWIINEMKASGLRGRGGAGFPTGMKWSFVPKVSEKPKYVLVNGDESEPGTCKDHVLFLHDPHSVIEGTMIAGLAIGSKVGFIYLRGEYRYLLNIVEKSRRRRLRQGLPGQEHFWPGGRGLRHHHADRRGCLRGGRGIRADGVARRQARRAPHQAAVSRCCRPVRRSHGHQQRGNHSQRAAHPAYGRGGVCQAWLRAQRGHAIVWHLRPRGAAGRVRASDGLLAA